MSGCGGGIRTHGDRINSPAPYQLGYTTEEKSGRGGDAETRGLRGRGDAGVLADRPSAGSLTHRIADSPILPFAKEARR